MVFEPRGRSSIAITGVVHGPLAPDVSRGVIAILGPVLGRRAGAFGKRSGHGLTNVCGKSVAAHAARTILPERSPAGPRPAPSGHGRWARTRDLPRPPPVQNSVATSGHAAARKRPRTPLVTVSQSTADRQALVGERVGGLDSTTRGPRGNGQPNTGGASPHPRPAGWPARATTACGRSSPSSLREERYEIQREVVRRDGADSAYEPRCPAAPSAVCTDARLVERRATDCWVAVSGGRGAAASGSVGDVPGSGVAGRRS
jgi:hypothetical protein